MSLMESCGTSRICGQISELATIFEDRVNVCILHRPGTRFEGAISGLDPWWHWRQEVDTAHPAPSLPALSPQMADDVRLWIEVLGELTGAARMGVRLQRVEAQMCPRFHADRVTVRLITTYVGQGTEWLDDGDVDRCWLGHASRGLPDETSGLIRPEAAVRSMATGDVGLFKGDAWPGNEGRGAVHRSPAAAPRLLLTIDPLG